MSARSSISKKRQPVRAARILVSAAFTALAWVLIPLVQLGDKPQGRAVGALIASNVAGPTGVQRREAGATSSARVISGSTPLSISVFRLSILMSTGTPVPSVHTMCNGKHYWCRQTIFPAIGKFLLELIREDSVGMVPL